MATPIYLKTMPGLSPSYVLCVCLMLTSGKCDFLSTPVDQNVLKHFPMELRWSHNETDIQACIWESQLVDIFFSFDYETGISGSNNLGWEIFYPDDPCRGGIRKKTTEQYDAKTYRMGVFTDNGLILSDTITVNVIQARDRSIDIETTNVRATLLPGRDVNVTLPSVIVDKGTGYPLVVRLNNNYPHGTKVIIQARSEQTLVHDETHVCAETPCEIDREILQSGEIGLRVCVQTDITAYPYVDIYQQIQFNENSVTASPEYTDGQLVDGQTAKDFLSSPVNQKVLLNYPMELRWSHNETGLKSCFWESDLLDIFMSFHYKRGIGGSNNLGWEFLHPDDPCRGGIRRRTTKQSDAKTYRMGVFSDSGLILSDTFTVNIIQARDRSIDVETTNVRTTFLPGRDVNVTLPPVIVDKGTGHLLVVRLNDNYPNSTKVTVHAHSEHTLVHDEILACVNTPCEIDRKFLPSGETGFRVRVQTDITAYPYVDIHQQIQSNEDSVTISPEHIDEAKGLEVLDIILLVVGAVIIVLVVSFSVVFWRRNTMICTTKDGSRAQIHKSTLGRHAIQTDDHELTIRLNSKDRSNHTTTQLLK